MLFEILVYDSSHSQPKLTQCGVLHVTEPEVGYWFSWAAGRKDQYRLQS